MTIIELLEEFEFTLEDIGNGLIAENHQTGEEDTVFMYGARGSHNDEIGVMLFGRASDTVVVSSYPADDMVPALTISFSRYDERTLRSILEVITWKGRG